ncbi:MAG TPA: hypothetical protein VFE05_03790, partial [Longimicrobiaceae bacterium]|nr:hypothetical protein [Longimicrobiaceae bacterium]
MPAFRYTLPLRAQTASRQFALVVETSRWFVRASTLLFLGSLVQSHSPPLRPFPPLLTRVAAAILQKPGLTPRLSVHADVDGCSSGLAGFASGALRSCVGASISPQSYGSLIALAGEARRALGGPSEAEALHALGLIDLARPDGRGKALDRAITSLRDAAQIDGSAAIWSDLSAAYLTRDRMMQNPRDLMEAIEAADRAVALDS